MFPLVRVTRTYKNLRRLRHIVNVLLKHGFGHLVEQMNLLPAVSLGRRLFLRKSHDREISRHTVPERLRAAFEELGPTFVKFGQLLSTRKFFRRVSQTSGQRPSIPLVPSAGSRGGGTGRSSLGELPDVRRDPPGGGFHCPGPLRHLAQRGGGGRQDPTAGDSGAVG